MRNLALNSVVLRVLVLALAATSVLPARPAAAQTVKLSATAGAADDELGHAVAVDGNTVIVGAQGRDEQGADSGAALVFVANGGGWVLQQKLLPNPNSAGAYFGSAVAILGDTAVVGAYGDANAGAFAGAVYVFKRTAGSWALLQRLTAADSAATKFFGYAVAMTSDTLVVGASGDATQGSNAGAAYVFALNAGSYTQQQKLVATGGTANNNFGVAVAISASTVLVGASGDVDNGNGTGSAYVFVKGGGGSFAQQQKLSAGSGSANDYFGNAVALSGDSAFVGAFADDAKGSDAGATYVFVRSGTTWTQSQKLFAADASAGDYFGFSLSVSGHDAVIGAPNASDNGSASGSAYTFRSNDSWTQRSKLHASDPAASDFFGYAVALNAGSVSVGANGKADFGANSGAGYVFAQPVTAVPALGGLGFVLMLALLALCAYALRRARRGVTKIVMMSVLLVLGCESKPSSSQQPTGSSPQTPVPAVQSLSNTVTLTATRDTAVRASAPNTNSGSATVLDLNRTLVDFDAAAIRSAVGPHDYITNAQLQLRLLTNLRRRTPRSALVYKLSQDWTETGATWNCASDANPANAVADCSGSTQWSMGAAPNPWALPASAVTAVPASISGSMSADLSSDVRAIAAGQSSLGWIIEGSAAGERNDFASRESTTPPQLVLSVRRCDPAQCDDGDPCTVDLCDATALCVHSAAVDGTSCNDGNACTQADSCLAGVCTGSSPITCAASDQCHVAGICDPQTGACNNAVAANGSVCNDGNACTQTDTCNAGVCGGGNAVACNAGDACHPGTCNPGNGTCSYTQACQLYGVGSISATATDGLAVSPKTLEDGLSNNLVGGFGSAITYTGVGNLYIATPDRGPNNGLDSYSNRYYEIEITLAGGTVTPRIVGSDTLKREDGSVFTGLGSAFDATGSSNSLRLDPEGVRVSPTGTFYVSDEYGPYVYEFGNDGKRLRALNVPSKFLIANPTDASHSELPPVNTSGRQSNRGMEGLAISPDGSKLYGMMQNALIQDGALNGSNSRVGLNNRLIEINTSTGATREFVYQLSNKSYGVNELLAVNDHQFLAIERDSNGGTAAAFKRVFLVDITGATDVSSIASLPTSGLPTGVTAVSKSAFIDLLAPEYGLAGATFPEKIEGLAFGPDQPNGNHTLVITNDNDFLGAAGNPDNFYVFSVNPSVLPGFVAPQPTFSSVCSSVTCSPADQCHAAGTCDPSSGACSNPSAADGTSCNDGNPVTTSDVCTAGVCAGVNLCATVTCTALDQCHVAGTCNPQNGTCSNPAATDGVTCNDGNTNTVADACVAGACHGTDLCASVTCTAADQCHAAGSCDHQTGLCSNPNVTDGTVCDDGNATTVSDACVGGLCAGTDLCASVTCSAADQCHVAGTCDYQTGACSNPSAADGASCNDGNANTVGDACLGGFCLGNDLCMNVTCVAQDQCHAAGNCNYQTGSCGNPAVADGTLCNDGNAVTVGDACVAGSCHGNDLCVSVTCTAQDQCHVAGTCAYQTGVCSNPAASNGSACDDGNAGTINDVCTSGACQGTDRCAGVVCSASDQCHVAGTCDSLTGACSNPAKANGTACNDSNACTHSDVCSAGACAGSAVVCAAGVDACHAGVCNPQNGTCSNTANQCSLYGRASISGTAQDGLIVSPRILEDGTPNNEIGAFGSAISYTGVGNLYVATPDRGPNNGLDSYNDRYYEIEISLAGGVVTPRVVGGDTFKREDGAQFTGLGSAFDATGSPAGSLRLDPEGVRVSPSGTMFVSDEYGPYVYEFGNDGKRLRSISVPSKFLIAHPADANGSELPPVNTSGRVTNRGMEGLALSPDGTKLYGLMQSPLLQDGALDGSNSKAGTNNRMLEITLSTGATREFLYQMVDKKYGLNELLAVNDHQFLVIERDANGETSAVFKKLFLIDISNATDISNVASLPTTGTPSGVTPVSKTLFLDLLSSDYGLAGASFPEKIEGITFGPDLPDGRHTLVTTNDNDFITDSTGHPNNFYVFAIGTPALPGFVAATHTFSSVCDTTTCVAAGGCYLPGTCDPSDGSCPDPTVASGTLSGTQTAGDCKKSQCDGSGNQVVINDNTDVPNDGNQCTGDNCVSGTPTYTNLSSGTMCTQSGGNVCDGAGGCVSCLTGSDCPGSDTTCAFRTCNSGTCGIGYAASGTPLASGSQIAGDCNRFQCDGSGGTVEVVDNSDVPNDSNLCTSDVCTSGVPSNPPVSAGVSCGTNQVCNGTGTCIAGCSTASDCPGSDTVCSTRTCNSGTCGVSYVANGTPTASQTSGDCHVQTCDGIGGTTSVIDNSDVPNDNNQCTNDLCTNGTASHTNVTLGTSCTQNSGNYCDTGFCMPTFRVVRLGTGSAALSSAATATFIEERRFDGVQIGTALALPTTASSSGNRALTSSGTAGTEGGLSLSGDGHYITLMGYNATAVTTTGVKGAGTDRVVGRINSSGTIVTTTSLPNSEAFTGDNPACAGSNDGSAFWPCGALGLRYALLGASGVGSSTLVNSIGTTGYRMAQVVGGKLYASTPAGGILTFATALPTSSSTGTTMPGITTSDAYSFVLLDTDSGTAGVDTLYVAEKTLGLKKFTFDGTTWSLKWTAATGIKGVAGVVAGSSVKLAATTSAADPNSIVTFTDAGGFTGTSAPTSSSIATAGTNTAYRGIALSPH